MNEFDLFGPLPEGTTVLEASAGTGKTFTIAALVARYIAEGAARIDDLLVVTFGRAATQELRDRVRERLVSARDGLADADAARTGPDEVLRHLAAVDDGELAERRQRLVVALACFDAATVATTHQFCQQMLIGLGTAADLDGDAELVENLDDLIDEVVDDLYLRKWAQDGAARPIMTPAEAKQLAHVVVDDGQAALVPAAVAGDDSAAATRVRFAQAARAEVERRKRHRRVISFDDLLTRLQEALADPHTGAAAAARLRSRYRVVLVDEFQDTDPVQWEVLRLAFHGAATLVLIGDPKQAIYAFRGADVHAYLDAAELAAHRATLARNWRSDPGLLRGLDALFRGAALGDPRIRVAPVAAAHDGRCLDSGDDPVQLRILPRADDNAGVARLRERVTADVVREIVTLLRTAPVLQPRDRSPARPVRPGDIAVIVRTGAQLDQVHHALLAAGVPSVQRTTSSVFKTRAAREWIVLLEALEQPHRAARVRRLAVSPFVGWTAGDLERDGAVDAFGLHVRHWVRVHAERGVAALFDTITRDERLAARLLSHPDGERLLTDLRHVGEALHAATMADELGLTAGLEWLRHRVTEAAVDATVERSRRLDTDAAAVQVVTVHSSKGLEFPVVYVPFAWDRFVRRGDVPLFHDPETGRRVRNVGGPGSRGFSADLALHNAEEFGEDLRLLYVAMTRAQARVTAWWAPSKYTAPSAPLHRLLFSDDPAVDVPGEVPLPSDSAVEKRARSFAEPAALGVTVVHGDLDQVSWSPVPGELAHLSVALFDRAVDLAWRRTSYSALTAAAHEAAPAIGSEPEVSDKDDEPITPAPTAPGVELGDVASPMAQLPGGARFGTLVHAVLENLDPHSDDLRTALEDQVRRQLARTGLADLDPDELTTALLPALQTPLEALAGRPLAELAVADRLAELEFEVPLRGGDRPNGRSSLRELAPLLRAHLAGDPLAGYADLLDDPVLGGAALAGYLTGSIDAVVRVDDRYVVIDYKTNRLGVPDTPLTAWDYRPAALAEAMLQAHYPLQALLYEVALHRFLRWRLADYDPARHLGGALYLFLRGMCGPDVRFADGSVPGVFAWQPPAALVVAASDLLAGGSSWAT